MSRLFKTASWRTLPFIFKAYKNEERNRWGFWFLKDDGSKAFHSNYIPPEPSLQSLDSRYSGSWSLKDSEKPYPLSSKTNVFASFPENSYRLRRFGGNILKFHPSQSLLLSIFGVL